MTSFLALGAAQSSWRHPPKLQLLAHSVLAGLLSSVFAEKFYNNIVIKKWPFWVALAAHHMLD
jgi:hypothetical protein